VRERASWQNEEANSEDAARVMVLLEVDGVKPEANGARVLPGTLRGMACGTLSRAF